MRILDSRQDVRLEPQAIPDLRKLEEFRPQNLGQASSALGVDLVDLGHGPGHEPPGRLVGRTFEGIGARCGCHATGQTWQTPNRASTLNGRAPPLVPHGPSR